MALKVAIDARDAAAAELRGWGRYTRELVCALRGRGGLGDELELVVFERGGPGPEVLFEQIGLPVALRRRGAALVHAPNCWLPLVRPCPGVVTIHDLAFETWPEDFVPRTRWKYRVLARAAARSAQAVICPSEFTAADVISRYGVAEARVRVIPEAPALVARGLPAPAARGLPAPDGPYLLAVGDLRRKKNLAALVRAFAALSSEDAIPHRLVLAGVDAGLGPELRSLAGAAPVELTGYVDDARLDALIRGAELLVHPSLYEGFGLVVLEAMARGTPVLAARAGALPETGGDAAAYFEPGVDGSLESELRVILADPARREAMAAAGLARAAGFSWARTAALTADVYRELIL